MQVYSITFMSFSKVYQLMRQSVYIYTKSIFVQTNKHILQYQLVLLKHYELHPQNL